MKKSILGFVAIFVSILVFSSCGATKQSAASLLSGRWNIMEVMGEKLTGEKLPFLDFDAAQGRLSGNAGCNNFNAAFKLDPTKPASLKIMPAAATLMACPDMENEAKVLKAFENVASVKKVGSALQLLDNNGAVVYLLEKALN